MTDIPKYKSRNVTSKLADAVSAAEAVREGIATHIQKHRAAQHEARKSAAAARKLTQES